MKFNLLLLICLFSLCTSFTFDNNPDKLCKENEENIFSFLLIKNQKVVSVCKDKDDKYIVYRFGTKDKIEFEYPNQLDKSSWKKFKYYYVHRSGGKENSGFGDISLSFTNNDAQYNIYHNWRNEEAINNIGIEVIVNGKTINLKGDIKTQTGALQVLEFESEKISNSAEEE